MRSSPSPVTWYRALAGRPALWLALQIALITVAVHVRGWGVVHEVPDSRSYIETGTMPPAEMLASIRTLGYPLFLRAVAVVSPGYAILPQLHLAFHFLAALLFYHGLKRFGATPWQAMAAATGVLWTVVEDPQVHDIASDSLARSVAVATVALLLVVVAAPRRWSWIALGVSLAFAYQVRPAYVYLVALVPCLGLVFLRIHAAWHGQPFRWKRFGATLLGLAVVPCLAFCLLRLAVVGHFGLVSFGGWNLSGLTVELLDGELIESRVPRDVQPLALDMLQARPEVHRLHGLQAAYRDARFDIAQLRENYDVNIYSVALPAARRHRQGREGPLPTVAINGDLTRLGRSVLAARKEAYLRFVLANVQAGLRDIPVANFTLTYWFALAAFLWLVRNLAWPRGPRRLSRPDDRRRSLVMQLLIALAVPFALAGLLLIAVVHMTTGRYLISVALFLPSVCVLWILQELQFLAADLRETYRIK